MKPGGHNFHPSRVKGSVKFGRNLELQRRAKRKNITQPVFDLSKPNWSMKK
jgi:hypothetical protein